MKQILIKQIRFLLFSAALSLCLLFMSAGKANATSYGLTVFDYSVQAGTVTGFHETYLDYNDRAYYYASVDGYLLNYGNDETLRNYQTVDYRFQDNYYDAAVQTFGNVQRGKIYATYSIHSVIARYVYGGGYYQDPDGFSNGYADTRQPTYNFTYGSPVIVGYQRIPVAATGVFVWLPNITGLSVSTANTGATREVEVFGKYIGEHSLINPVVSVSGSGVTVGVTRIVPGEGVVLNVQVADDATPGERQLSLQSGTAPNRVPSNSVPFNVTNNPPNLTSIDVASSLPGASVATSLRGQNLFGQNQSVSVDGTGVTATIRANQQPNEIEILDVTLEIAENASRGDHNIMLTVNGRTSNAVVFRVGDRSPIITGISRQEGEMGEVVGVTITGQNFGLNPQITFDGTGIFATVQNSSSTQIVATFALGDNTYEGDRGVRVRSLGLTGTGFQQTPGASDTSNSVRFTINPPNITPQIPPIQAVGKNDVIRPIILITPSTNTRDVQLKLTTISGTGQAVFVQTGNDIMTIQQTTGVDIKGVVESSVANNIKIEALYNGRVLHSRVFSVVLIESAIFKVINSMLDDNPGNGEIGSNVGQRIFPDKTDPYVATDNSVVTVEAKVRPAVANLQIYFANYDLDDPSTNAVPVDPNAGAGDDNNGKVGISSAGELSASSGQTCETWAKGVNCPTNTDGISTAQFQVTMNPGDNFAIAASVNQIYLNNVIVDTTDGTKLKDSLSQFVPISGDAGSGSANSVALRTKMLTVWRNIHLEVDSMDSPGTVNNVTGTITNIGVLPCPTTPPIPPCVENEGYVVNTGTVPLEIQRFNNGRILVNKKYYQVLANLPGNQVILKGIPAGSPFVRIGSAFTLYDDDDFNDDDGINKDGDANEVLAPLPTFQLSENFKLLYDGDGISPDGRRNIYQSAYIRPEYNWAITKLYNQTNVTFNLNVKASSVIADDEVTPTINAFRNSINDERDDFWVGYFLTGYQGSINEDADGQNISPRTGLLEDDTANPGITGGILSGDPLPCDCISRLTCPVIRRDSVCRVYPRGGKGSLIYREVQMDVTRTWAAVGRTFRDFETTAPHELGHQFGLLGDVVNPTFKIMDYSHFDIKPVNTVINDAAFHPEHINIMRRRIKSPGQ